MLIESPRLRTLVTTALAGLAGAVAALLALQLAPPTQGDVGPGTVEVRGRWSLDSQTRLRVPPLGSVSADTHATPLYLDAVVQELDLVEVQELLGRRPTRARLEAEAEDGLRALIRSFARRSLVTAALAGALAGALVGRHRARWVVTGTLGGLAAVGLLLFGTWRGFDAEAFAEPTYAGALERAPEVVEVARRHVDRIDDLEARVGLLAAGISDLYALAASPLVPRADEVRILHVSDIHSNPLGVEVAVRLAQSFDVHAVLDTGDLTSFGSPIEPTVVERISEIEVPYLFVPGNHDSDPNRELIGALPNVTLFEEDVASVRGVRILGVADPTFTADNRITSEEAARIRLNESRRVARLVRRHRPDVLAVHDARMATHAHGQVRLVVSGHLHQRRMAREEGTISITVGSTGATGLGSFAVEEGLPYEAHVMRFVGGCLSALDALRLEGVTGGFNLERRVIELDRDDVRCRATGAAPGRP